MRTSNQNRMFFNTRNVVSVLLLVGVLTAWTAFFQSNHTMANADTPKLLRHVVMFKFKDASSKEDIQKVVEAFQKLPTQIPEIKDFEFGTNNSPEDHDNGFTHCFLVTFASEKDREAYLPHQAHKQFVEVLLPHLDKVQVIDYWASK